MIRSKREYLYGLDIVRFCAAVGVAVFHLSWRIPATSWMLPFGWVGVEIFFVISGLVIANSAFGSTARNFAIGRFLRIYPGAWCCALLSFLILRAVSPQIYSGTLGVNGTSYALVGSLALVRYGYLASAYWTLPIEITFYAFIAILLLVKGFDRVRFWSFALILWSTPYLFLLVLQIRGRIHIPSLDFGYERGNCSLLRHGCYFGLGMLIWVTQKRRVKQEEILFVGIALLAALCEIYARAKQLAPITGRIVTILGRHWAALPVTIAAYLTFLAACTAIVFSARYASRFPASLQLRKIVRTVGLSTYPFYLLHEVLGGYVRAKIISFNPTLSIFCALVAVGAASVVVAIFAEPLLRNGLQRIGFRMRQTEQSTVSYTVS